MSYDQRPLTPEGVQQFMSKLRGDDALQKEVIRLIQTEGALAMINQFFKPNGKQQKVISSLEKIMNTAFVQALETSGKITLSQTNQESLSGHIGVHNGPDGTSVDVEITCAI